MYRGCVYAFAGSRLAPLFGKVAGYDRLSGLTGAEKLAYITHLG
jgi:hypothetical protein